MECPSDNQEEGLLVVQVQSRSLLEQLWDLHCSFQNTDPILDLCKPLWQKSRNQKKIRTLIQATDFLIWH